MNFIALFLLPCTFLTKDKFFHILQWLPNPVQFKQQINRVLFCFILGIEWKKYQNIDYTTKIREIHMQLLQEKMDNLWVYRYSCTASFISYRKIEKEISLHWLQNIIESSSFVTFPWVSYTSKASESNNG